MRASNLTYGKKISILLKSPPGFGKTIAACSSAVDGPVYLAYFDKNEPIELLTFFKRHRPELLENIEYDVYSSSNANKYLNKLMDLTRDCRYTTVITDSVTNFTSAAVNWSMGFRSEGGKKDKLSKDSTPQLIPDWDEYKVETSMVAQALDISKTLPCNVIWTAHPLKSTRVEGSGASMKVSKTVNIVSYGSKAADLIPGNFTEIYHFSQKMDWSTNKKSYVVDTTGVGDDFAKTALDLPAEFDITDKLFWEVWKDLLNKKEDMSEIEKTIAAVGKAYDETKWKI